MRDYIHVDDLCEAHLLALDRLMQTGKSARYNLGNGNGFSVKQVIDVVKEVTGQQFKVVLDARRAGDPATLVANSTLAKRELQWAPRYPSIVDIVTHAWNADVRARLN